MLNFRDSAQKRIFNKDCSFIISRERVQLVFFKITYFYNLNKTSLFFVEALSRKPKTLCMFMQDYDASQAGKLFEPVFRTINLIS